MIPPIGDDGHIQRRAFAILEAERRQLDDDCCTAMDLTPPDRWSSLQVIVREVPLGAPHIPAAVACRWP